MTCNKVIKWRNGLLGSTESNETNFIDSNFQIRTSDKFKDSSLPKFYGQTINAKHKKMVFYQE